MTTEDRIRTIARAKQLLAERGRENGIELHLLEEDSREEDGWFYLAVAPVRPDTRLSDYAQMLECIEDDLEEEGLNRVLLLPDIPD